MTAEAASSRELTPSITSSARGLMPAARGDAPRRNTRGRAVAGAAVVVVLLAAPLARAGGDFVDLAVGTSHVWFVGEPGVRELDAHTGHTIASPQLTGAPYPLSVTVAGGSAWVASVENGYVWGTLTLINLRTHHVRMVWRKQDSSIQYVAAGAGGVWALIGSPSGNEIARFSLAGRLTRVWKIPAAGRMAADASGCWISTSHWLLHIDAAGHLQRVLQAQLGDVSTGLGAAWLPQAVTVLRIDEQTGQIRTLHTGPLRLGGFQHDLTAGDGALWALNDTGRTQSIVKRFNLRSGRTTGTLELPGIADALIATPDAIWVATVIAPPNMPATGYDVIRINPHTLHRTLLVQIT